MPVAAVRTSMPLFLTGPRKRRMQSTLISLHHRGPLIGSGHAGHSRELYKGSYYQRDLKDNIKYYIVIINKILISGKREKIGLQIVLFIQSEFAANIEPVNVDRALGDIE